MSDEQFDVVVIGAGLGGLSAGGYLAKAGKRVLVLEHHTVPGGYAHEFRRGRYRFEVALHALDGVGPGGWAHPILRDLGVLDRVTFRRLDPLYTVQFPQHLISAHADVFEYEAELVRQFPAEAQGIRSLIDAMLRAYWDVQRFIKDGELGRRPPMAQIPATYPAMLGAMGMSWGDFMQSHISDPQLQAVLTTLWGYFGLPPGELSAAVFIFAWASYHLFGAYYPEGGSQAMSRALEQFIREHGGDVRYRQTVNGIEIVNGRAVAVTTEAGLRVTTTAVVSNANPQDTLLRFVGAEHLPESYRAKLVRDDPALSNLVVYLGLEQDLAANGFEHHEFFVSETYDLAADYTAVVDGNFEQAGLVITSYTPNDPTNAPPGSSILVIMTLAPWDYANVWGTGGNLAYYQKNPHYLELKQDAAEKLISRVEPFIPNLRASIRHMEVATPLTNYRYSLNPGGSIYGSEQTVDNMYVNRLRETTPVKNLFLTGAWVAGGGMSAALVSGRSVARRVLSHLDGATTPRPDTAQAATPVPHATDAPVAQADRLPALVLKAAGSEREVDLRNPGSTAVLLLHTQESARTAGQNNSLLRDAFPDPGMLLIANVVDLSGVPRFFRPMASGAMKSSYERISARLAADLDPARLVVILPDWDGSVLAATGLSDVSVSPGLVVADREGMLLGVFQGATAVEAAVQLLRDRGQDEPARR